MSAFGKVPEEFSELMGGPRITAGLLRRYADTDQFAEPHVHEIDLLRLRKLPKDINKAVPEASGLLDSRDDLGWPGMLPGEEVGAAAKGVGRTVGDLAPPAPKKKPTPAPKKKPTPAPKKKPTD